MTVGISRLQITLPDGFIKLLRVRGMIFLKSGAGRTPREETFALIVQGNKSFK